MIINNGILKIELNMALEDVCELKEIVLAQLDRIEEIHFIGEALEFSTSSLFALLFAIKKSKPKIKIPLIDEGAADFKNYGKVYWNSEEVQ